MEKAVSFKNKDGKYLFGILHIPDHKEHQNKRIGVNLLNPGTKYRVAPNRLNVKIARKLCKEGYFVLRFDPSGIGDSEGNEYESIFIFDLWRKIQDGLLVSDTICANDYFIKECKLDELILAGACGGAVTSLLTSTEYDRVDRLCLIDLPIFLFGEDMKTSVDLVVADGKKRKWLFSEYLKRIISLEAWVRLITLKSDFRSMYKVLKLTFIKNKRKKYNIYNKEEMEKFCIDHKLNIKMFEASELIIKKKKKTLYILAENDHGYECFERYFQTMYLQEIHQELYNKKLIEVHTIKDANHIYTLEKWQNELMDLIYNWINKN